MKPAHPDPGLIVTDLATQSPASLDTNRRQFLTGVAGAAVLAAVQGREATAQAGDAALNIARVATPTGYAMASENKISALNDDFSPENSFDRSHGLYALHGPRNGDGQAPWAQYEWTVPVSIGRVEVYWAVDRPRPVAFPGPMEQGCTPQRATGFCTGTAARSYR